MGSKQRLINGPCRAFLGFKTRCVSRCGVVERMVLQVENPCHGNQKPFERSCYGIEKFHAFHEFLPWEQFSHKEGISKGDENWGSRGQTTRLPRLKNLQSCVRKTQGWALYICIYIQTQWDIHQIYGWINTPEIPWSRTSKCPQCHKSPKPGRMEICWKERNFRSPCGEFTLFSGSIILIHLDGQIWPVSFCLKQIQWILAAFFGINMLVPRIFGKYSPRSFSPRSACRRGEHACGWCSVREVRWCSIPEPLGHGGFHRETMFDLENGYQHIMKVVSRGLDIQNLVV